MPLTKPLKYDSQNTLDLIFSDLSWIFEISHKFSQDFINEGNLPNFCRERNNLPISSVKVLSSFETIMYHFGTKKFHFLSLSNMFHFTISRRSIRTTTKNGSFSIRFRIYLVLPYVTKISWGPFYEGDEPASTWHSFWPELYYLLFTILLDDDAKLSGQNYIQVQTIF